MAPNVGYKAYFSFTSGQNSSAAPDNLKDDEMREIRNFDIILRGALMSRPGTVADDLGFITTPGTSQIDRIAILPKTSGTPKTLILTGGNLYVSGSTTPLLSAVGTHMDYTIYQDKMYLLLNGKYYVYDGTTIAEVTKAGVSDNNLTEIAKCKYILTKGERIYASGNPDAPSALYYSQVGDPAYFKTGDFRIFANSGDGDAISGLHEFQNAVIVFKTRGIWKYEGVSAAVDGQFTKLMAETGTRSHRTIKNVMNFVFFLGNDGVYALKTTQLGTIVTEKVSSMIDDVLSRVQHTDSWWQDSAVAEVIDGKYVLAFSKDPANKTKNTEVAVCHVATGIESNVTPWTMYDGLGISCMAATLNDHVYLGDSSGQYVYHFDNTKLDDRGTAITYKLVTKDYDLDSPIHVKKLKRGWLIFRQYEAYDSVINLSVIVDYAEKTFEEKSLSDSLVWDKGMFGIHRWGWIDTVTLPIKIGKKGIRARMEVTATSDATLENEIFMYGFAFEYKTKKPYK